MRASRTQKRLISRATIARRNWICVRLSADKRAAQLEGRAQKSICGRQALVAGLRRRLAPHLAASGAIQARRSRVSRDAATADSKELKARNGRELSLFVCAPLAAVPSSGRSAPFAFASATPKAKPGRAWIAQASACCAKQAQFAQRRDSCTEHKSSQLRAFLCLRRSLLSSAAKFCVSVLAERLNCRLKACLKAPVCVQKAQTGRVGSSQNASSKLSQTKKRNEKCATSRRNRETGNAAKVRIEEFSSELRVFVCEFLSASFEIELNSFRFDATCVCCFRAWFAALRPALRALFGFQSDLCENGSVVRLLGCFASCQRIAGFCERDEGKRSSLLHLAVCFWRAPKLSSRKPFAQQANKQRSCKSTRRDCKSPRKDMCFSLAQFANCGGFVCIN